PAIVTNPSQKKFSIGGGKKKPGGGGASGIRETFSKPKPHQLTEGSPFARAIARPFFCPSLLYGVPIFFHLPDHPSCLLIRSPRTLFFSHKPPSLPSPTPALASSAATLASSAALRSSSAANRKSSATRRSSS